MLLPPLALVLLLSFLWDFVVLGPSGDRSSRHWPVYHVVFWRHFVGLVVVGLFRGAARILVLVLFEHLCRLCRLSLLGQLGQSYVRLGLFLGLLFCA